MKYSILSLFKCSHLKRDFLPSNFQKPTIFSFYFKGEIRADRNCGKYAAVWLYVVKRGRA